MISLSSSHALGSLLTSQGNCREKAFRCRHVEQTPTSLARRKARRGSHTFLITIVITFIITIIRVQSDHTQHRYPIYTIFSCDTNLEERREEKRREEKRREERGAKRASASQTMTQHVRNENKRTRLFSVTPRTFETSLVQSSQPSFQSPPVPPSSKLNPLQPAH